MALVQIDVLSVVRKDVASSVWIVVGTSWCMDLN